MDQGRERCDQGARLPCLTFAANAVRLELYALAHNLENFLCTLMMPKPIKYWLLTTLREYLIKIGEKIMSHCRYVAFPMAEVAIPRQMFQKNLGLILELRPKPSHRPRQQETAGAHPLISNQCEDCAYMPRKSVQAGRGNTISEPD
jgi:hypothetical protein